MKSLHLAFPVSAVHPQMWLLHWDVFVAASGVSDGCRNSLQDVRSTVRVQPAPRTVAALLLFNHSGYQLILC